MHGGGLLRGRSSCDRHQGHACHVTGSVGSGPPCVQTVESWLQLGAGYVSVHIYRRQSLMQASDTSGQLPDVQYCTMCISTMPDYPMSCYTMLNCTIFRDYQWHHVLYDGVYHAVSPHRYFTRLGWRASTGTSAAPTPTRPPPATPRSSCPCGTPSQRASASAPVPSMPRTTRTPPRTAPPSAGPRPQPAAPAADGRSPTSRPPPSNRCAFCHSLFCVLCTLCMLCVQCVLCGVCAVRAVRSLCTVRCAVRVA